MLEKLSQLGKLTRQVWNILNFVLPFIPLLSEIVKFIESEEPDDDEKRGEKKKELALKFAERLYNLVDDLTEEDLPVPLEKFQDFVASLVDILVDMLNFFGRFRSS